MELVMTGRRSMLLASALMAIGGVWAGSASAAPIHADMALQGDAVFEQVQMRGHSGSGGNRGGGMSVGRSGGGASFSRGSGGGMSVGRSSGGNWSGNRAISGGNFANNSRQSFAGTNNRPGNWSGNNWNGRRADFRRHRGSRGPVVAFGFGPSYYDYGYGYDSGYYPYDDDAYAYAPGAAVADDGSCAQRFRSYDPSTGTYLGYDGLRHPCP
jgi:hypothetical protein